MNGSLRKHEKCIGYVVIVDGRVGSLCYGYEDLSKRVLLHGPAFTLFATRKQAAAAVRESKTQCREGVYSIERVVPLSGRKS